MQFSASEVELPKHFLKIFNHVRMHTPVEAQKDALEVEL